MNGSTAALVERAKAGEAGAFDDLVHRHGAGLVRFVRFIVADADEAESLAQESLVRAYEQLAEFQPRFRFGAWLRGIALNVCRNYLRGRARHASVRPPGELDGQAARSGRKQGVLSNVLRREVAGRLEASIRELPEALRDAFVLHAVEGLSYDEIAELLGVTPGTARVRAHRARILLRHSLGPVVDTWMREAQGS